MDATMRSPIICYCRHVPHTVTRICTPREGRESPHGVRISFWRARESVSRMAKEIIISAEKKQTRIAIVEHGQLAELHIEDPENARTLGDIYLGCIRRLMPSIRAAFVDIGQKQDAFLHYSDLAENLELQLQFVKQDKPHVQTFYRDHSGPLEAVVPAGNGRKRGSKDLLRRDQRVLVQIVKEPISHKGSRVSTGISLAGRFLILVPLANYTAVSKKIASGQERRRLKELAKMLAPEGFGVIVRTVAEGKDAKSLHTDMRLLRERWARIEKKLALRPDGPAKIHQDVSMASSIIRDIFSDDYDRILVNERRMHRKIKNYVQAVAPQMAPAVQLHTEKTPIFEHTGIAEAIAEVFDSRVSLPSGGYLIIERTEAMHVIDVNSGSSGRGMKQEDSSLQVNLEAARVLARQVRLRDLGGIIVVDFIDMRNEKGRGRVFAELEAQFRADRAVTAVLPMSDFGLIEITRQRLRPSITATFGDEGNPVASGRRKRPGRRKVASDTPAELVASVEEWLHAYTQVQEHAGGIRLVVHPFTAAYLSRGLLNMRRRWQLRYKLKVHLETNGTLSPMVFRCLDPDTGKDITRSPRPPRKSPPRSKSAQGVRTVKPMATRPAHPASKQGQSRPKKPTARPRGSAPDEKASSNGRPSRNRPSGGRRRQRPGKQQKGEPRSDAVARPKDDAASVRVGDP